MIWIEKPTKEEIREIFVREWGSEIIVTRENNIRYDDVDGFIAKDQDRIMGLITFIRRDREIEIVSLNSFHEDHGIGTMLLDRVIEVVGEVKASRLFLITMNNNARALDFYRKKGFEIVEIYKNSIERSRKIKTEIPLFDEKGIEIRDEIEMEYNIK